MDTSKSTVKKPRSFIFTMILSVVSISGAIYLYFWSPSPDAERARTAAEVVRLESIARVLVNQKKYDQAITQINKAIALDPENDDLIMDRAAALYCKKDFDQALNDYQRVATNCANTQKRGATDANCSNARLGTALCQVSLKRSQLAVKTLHELQIADSHYVRAYQLLGDIYLKDGNSEAALDAYTQGLRLNPKSAALHYDRSLAYLKREMKDQAYDDLSAAVELDKSSLSMRLKHANIAQKLGKLEIADSDAHEILRLEPGNRSAMSWLAKREKGPLPDSAESDKSTPPLLAKPENAGTPAVSADKAKPASAPGAFLNASQKVETGGDPGLPKPPAPKTK